MTGRKGGTPPITRRTALGVGIGAGLLAAPAVLRAQGAWPNKTITLFVGYPPGGQTDFAARVLQQGLSTALGQTVVIENRGGAGGNLATDVVLRAPLTVTGCSPATPALPSTPIPCRAPSPTRCSSLPSG